MRRLRWILIAIGALVVLVVGGTWFYIHVIEGPAPKPLTFQGRDAAVTTSLAPSGQASTTAAPASTAAPAASGLAGKWTATGESQAGYRVKEILFGQHTEAVGRTNAVTGEVDIAGSAVQSASFSVDLTQVTSDQRDRDGQFRGRIMNVAQFPTATFTLTQPVGITADAADRQEVPLKATGDLTVRGTTKTVIVDLVARRNGGNIEVNGSIPIVFAEWGIPNPTFGPASTEDHGVIEFLLVFTRVA